MRIARDDLNEYKLLKKSSVRDFLNKFDIFVQGIQRKIKENGRNS